VLVVGANLCTDRTLRMERLVPGAVQRPRSAEMTAGGKAVNVCRAARAHGVHARLVGNLPGELGGIVVRLLVGEGIDVRRVATRGELRSAIVILEDDMRVTVLNEPGPPLEGADRTAFVDAVTEELSGHGVGTGQGGRAGLGVGMGHGVGIGHRVVVMSGSLPPAPEQDLYADLVDRARRAGVISVVDAARDALAAALQCGPDVVTPNLAEARGLLDAVAAENVEPGGDDVPRQAMAAARALHARGAGAALVTVGRYGVAGVHAGGAFWVSAPSVRELNPIGAGDAFASGLAAGLEAGESIEAATVRAVASGSAAVPTPLAGQVDPVLFQRLLRTVTAEAA
jgi:fructose-1-phosphate kinase PfkB-like protein